MEEKPSDMTINLQGFNVEKAPNVINRGISVIVYANPGVGKTTLATSLPPESTLIINAEAGLGPLIGKGHAIIHLQNIQSKGGVPEIVAGLLTSIRQDAGKTIRNVVIDNVSELLNLALLETTVKRGKAMPSLQEHGESSFRVSEWMHQFRDLTFLGINVVFNAWEQVMEIAQSDGVIVTKTVPMIGKKTAVMAAGIVDICAHLEVHEKTGKRWLRIAPSDQYLTKCQFGWVKNTLADLPSLFDEVKKGEV